MWKQRRSSQRTHVYEESVTISTPSVQKLSYKLGAHTSFPSSFSILFLHIILSPWTPCFSLLDLEPVFPPRIILSKGDFQKKFAKEKLKRKFKNFKYFLYEKDPSLHWPPNDFFGLFQPLWSFGRTHIKSSQEMFFSLSWLVFPFLLAAGLHMMKLGSPTPASRISSGTS